MILLLNILKYARATVNAFGCIFIGAFLYHMMDGAPIHIAALSSFYTAWDIGFPIAFVCGLALYLTQR